MAILSTQSKFGHAPPPQTPYSIVTNIPGWDMLKTFRDGDKRPLQKIVNIYPRLAPTTHAKKLSQEIAKRVGLEEWSCFMYLDPAMWRFTEKHATNDQRKEFIMPPERLDFKVVDIAHHRLYCVLFEPRWEDAVHLSWGLPGLGLSIRESEHLLENIRTLVQVPMNSIPTWTPEDASHEGLRSRIIELLQHGAIDAQLVQCKPRDVYLYPSGMAAIFETKNVMEAYRKGKTNVELGMVFHNTHQLLLEESEGGWKHFAAVSGPGLDKFEGWLGEEAGQEREVAFAIVEIPGNPTLESPDLPRLKKLSEKYGFVMVVDETVGSFSNIDVLSQADMLITSLTKSFNGRSDALGGSVVLNPLSSHYAQLSTRFSEAHHNQLFAADAQVLLSNSQDYFQRSQRLNANAQAMAEFLHKNMLEDDDSPVISVQYPSLLSSKANYDVWKRRSTPEMPNPGYGCLLTVEFDSVETTRAFYDQCGFYPSPHLGGHVTIMFAYNMFMFGKDQEEARRLVDYGIREESVRISAGLEETQDLLDTLRDALDAAVEAKRDSGLRERGETYLPIS
ncbi:hypothetical protein E4U56_007123 [Claviceps arundinis]|uniref:Cystathionine gamma-synthase n=1 Tax=Claviceps arundinis TaxID=1623583 RepID=A0A9P7MVM6_9HYPO|nr:hypothetical protein E4U56_007123 [Claviceps arundinis]